MDINWETNIYNSIKDISNLPEQKRLWLGLDKNYCSSFDETISMILDSFSFNEFVEEFRSKGENHILINELNNLKEMLESYERKGTDEEILEDPNWMIITKKADQIIKTWDAIRAF